MPERISAPDFTFDSIPSIKDELLKIKEAYVTPKEDFFGWFFKQPEPNEARPILETTYYYEKWRKYALSATEPHLYKIFTTCVEKLNIYFDTLGNAYKEHLLTLLAGKEAVKTDLSSQLSEEEQLLQNDDNWLVRFTDAVNAIARE